MSTTVTFVKGAILVVFVLVSLVEIYSISQAKQAWLVTLVLRIGIAIGIWISGGVLSEWFGHLARMEMIAWKMLEEKINE